MKSLRIKHILPGILLILLFVGACETLDELGPGSIFATWFCVENSEIYNETNYFVDISQHPSEQGKIVIDNFYNLGYGKEITATQNGYSIAIPSQIVDGNTISGSATIAADYRKISLTYMVDDGGGQIDNVTAVYTKE
jgi:hypothetical protein